LRAAGLGTDAVPAALARAFNAAHSCSRACGIATQADLAIDGTYTRISAVTMLFPPGARSPFC
jgi:hypothetical protein